MDVTVGILGGGQLGRMLAQAGVFALAYTPRIASSALRSSRSRISLTLLAGTYRIPNMV